ncbi:MAG: transporter substrate-binding domain-containing protein [Chloroflexota bacterium]
MNNQQPNNWPIRWLIRLFLLTILTQPIGLPSASLKAQGIATQGTLVIGVSEAEPPFAARASNDRLVGFDLALIKMLARTAGLRVTYEAVPFPQLIPGVATRLFDAALTCIAVTDERAKLVNFTATYFTFGIMLVVSEENNSIVDLSTLSSTTRVSLLRGSVFESVFRAQSDIEPIFVSSTQQGLALVAAGAADATLADDIAVEQFLRTHADARLKIASGPIEKGQCAIAVSKENPRLLVELDAALTRLKNNGKFLTTYRRWFGSRPLSGPRPISQPSSELTQDSDGISAVSVSDGPAMAMADTVVGIYRLTLATDPRMYQLIDLAPTGVWLESSTQPQESTLPSIQSLAGGQVVVQEGAWRTVNADPIAMTVNVSATVRLSPTLSTSMTTSIDSSDVISTNSNIGTVAETDTEINGTSDVENNSRRSVIEDESMSDGEDVTGDEDGENERLDDSELVLPIQPRKEYQLTIQDNGTVSGHYILYASAEPTVTLVVTETVELVGQRIIE